MVAVFSFGMVFANGYAKIINQALDLSSTKTISLAGEEENANKFVSEYGSLEEAKEADKELAERLTEEGVVLLKNNGALPLANNAKVTILGHSSTNILVCGTGSADINASLDVEKYSSSLKSAKGYLTLKAALEDRTDVSVNDTVWKTYMAWTEAETYKTNPAMVNFYSQVWSNATELGATYDEATGKWRGGESDATDVLSAPEGRLVYTDYVTQGRKTYKTLVILDAGVYFVYNHATNSNNGEQTTGAMFGYGSFEIKDSNKGIVPDESKPEETYDIVTGEAGVGYMYANNNGSHMHFDLQNSSGFLSWLATSFNAPSPTFYVSETGFTMKLGALKTVIGPWGLYIPAGDSTEQEEEPVAENLTLEVETSVEGKPFILQLNADGTLVLDVAYESTVTENAEGGLDITVNYGQMGEKTYTMTADQAKAILN